MANNTIFDSYVVTSYVSTRQKNLYWTSSFLFVIRSRNPIRRRWQGRFTFQGLAGGTTLYFWKRSTVVIGRSSKSGQEIRVRFCSQDSLTCSITDLFVQANSRLVTQLLSVEETPTVSCPFCDRCLFSIVLSNHCSFF